MFAACIAAVLTGEMACLAACLAMFLASGAAASTAFGRTVEAALIAFGTTDAIARAAGAATADTTLGIKETRPGNAKAPTGWPSPL
jgi:hypothetical protein